MYRRSSAWPTAEEMGPPRGRRQHRSWCFLLQMGGIPDEFTVESRCLETALVSVATVRTSLCRHSRQVHEHLKRPEVANGLDFRDANQRPSHRTRAATAERKIEISNIDAIGA